MRDGIENGWPWGLSLVHSELTRMMLLWSGKELFLNTWISSLSFFLQPPLHPFIYLFIFVFLGLHLRHMDVPRLGVDSELQLLAYTTGTAMPDPSYVCNLHPSSRQGRILNPLSKFSDRTWNLIVPSRIHFHCTTMGTPRPPPTTLALPVEVQGPGIKPTAQQQPEPQQLDT